MENLKEKSTQPDVEELQKELNGKERLIIEYVGVLFDDNNFSDYAEYLRDMCFMVTTPD